MGAVPPHELDPALLDRVQYLWISHEHPDHFHIPTLRSLPEDFKRRVEVLYQHNNSEKMWKAFKGFGFERFRAMPHRKIMELTPGTSAYCYHEAQMNSCLAVMSRGATVINVNDAEIRRGDCQLIRADIGDCDVVLNQFSIAGYSGLSEPEQRLPRAAKQILQNMADNHRDLHAKVTIPFASFVYFCAEDNKYINEFANRPRDVARKFADDGLDLAVLYPGDVYDLAAPVHSNALERFDASFATFGTLPFTKSKVMSIGDIEQAFRALSTHLQEMYPLMLSLLGAVVVRIPDLETVVRWRLATGELTVLDSTASADLEIASQPLWFAFKFPFGVQTLGVSGRYKVLRKPRNWQAHRILFAMNNAEVYLRPRHLFGAEMRRYALQRMRGSGRQILRRLSTMTE